MASGTQWAINDGLDSIRGIVNASATPLESRLYAPYGEPIQLSGSSQSNLGYTGQPTDVTGMVYLRARYLSPSFGQFLSLDPVETANRYAYVDGNAVNATDPSGLLIKGGGGKPPVTPWGGNANPNPGGVAGGFKQCGTGYYRQGNYCIKINLPNANPNPGGVAGGFSTQHVGNTGSPTQSTRGDEYLPPDQQAFSVSQSVNGEVQTVITGNTTTVLGSQGCPPGWRAIVRGRTTVCERMNGIGGGQLTPQDAWADYAIDQTVPPPPVSIWELIYSATILPTLALYEDPSLVMQAIGEFLASNGQGASLATVAPAPVAQGAGLIGLGIFLGIGVLLGINAISRGLDSPIDTGILEARTPRGLPFGQALERAPGFYELSQATERRWDRRGCYRTCPKLEGNPTPTCEQLTDRYAPIAAAAPTCGEAEDIINAYVNVLNVANGGSNCRPKHCRIFEWG